MITFGVCQWILDRKGVDAVHRAGELGFRAIQLGIPDVETVTQLQQPESQTAYKNAAVEAGVVIVGIGIQALAQSGLQSDPQSENGQTVWQVLTGVIDAALAMGIPLVYCPSLGDGEIKTEADLSATAAVLRRACDYIGERPLTLATENSLDVAGNRKLIEQVGHPRFKVLVDAYNPVVYGHHAVDLIRGLPDHLCNQFHAKDGLDKQRGVARLGEGDGGFAESVAALKEIDFRGYIICENNYDADAEARTALDLATLRTLFDTGDAT